MTIHQHSSRQRSVGSPFTASSTVADVIEGVDLTGRNAVVTGGHSGLGLVITRALVEAGASVTVASRSLARARAALDGLERVDIGRLDLLDPASVDAFTARYLGSGRPLHLLVNNAGFPTTELTHDARGYEVQFAANHLGHFQLTRGLYPALRAAGGARVVNTTSGAQRMSDILWDDVHFTTGAHEPHLAYAQSKTANVLHAVELDRRWASDGIRGYAAHPGVVAATAFNSSVGEQAQRAMGLIDDAGLPIIDPEAGKKSPEQGASTIVFAAVSPLLADVGGVYLNNNDVAPIDDRALPPTADEIPADATSHAVDPDSARRLWVLSEQLLARP